MKTQDFIIGFVVGLIIVFILSKLSKSGYQVSIYYTLPDFSTMTDYNAVLSSFNTAESDIHAKTTAAINVANGETSKLDANLTWHNVLCALVNNFTEWKLRNAERVIASTSPSP